MIIDGHHRYTALKELGYKKAPVTLVNYFSDKIITDEKTTSQKMKLYQTPKKEIYINQSLFATIQKVGILTLISSWYPLKNK